MLNFQEFCESLVIERGRDIYTMVINKRYHQGSLPAIHPQPTPATTAYPEGNLILLRSARHKNTSLLFFKSLLFKS